MDPEERIRRREERRRRRESEKNLMEKEFSETKQKRSELSEDSSTNVYEKKTIIKESSTELESRPVILNDNESKWNGDENHNDTKEEHNEEHNEEYNEEQNEDYSCTNGNESDSKASTISDQTEREVEVKQSKIAVSVPNKPAAVPEALNVYKEIKKTQDDESFKNAIDQLRIERNQIAEELKERKRRKAERARQWEEADRVQQRHAEERRMRQQEEEQRLKQEFEKKKKERELRMKKMAHNPYAYLAPVVVNGKAPPKFSMKSEAREREKKKVLAERVPPLDIRPNTNTEALRQLAEDLVEKLKTAYGRFFDLEYQGERSKYTIHELKTRIKAMNKYSYERQVKASAVGLSDIVKQLEQAQSTNGRPKSRLEREKQAGSILGSGGVKARLNMFGGGSLNRSNRETQSHQVDLTK
ncbi:uncharacterized protein [Antedon mediterranea]|uniref:uncharacterized protein n=1 Tax=Antedon mediterranea TaxID=105859 RepID=UPI003AF9F549